MPDYELLFLGTKMAQEWQDIHIWEQFFLHHPINTLIELGTGYGGLSTYFALQAFQRGFQFQTYDNQAILDYDKPIQRILNMRDGFHHIDIFTEADQIISAIQSVARPLAIFFDNGDKPREWRTFAPHTLPGDYLVVHDWGTEFNAGDIGGTQVERILTDLSDGRGPGWKSMWFKRV